MATSAGVAGSGGTDQPTAHFPTVATGAGPVGLAVDERGAVWVANSNSSDVRRIRDDKVDLTVSGVATPLRLAATRDSVWATAFGSGEVVRFGVDRGEVLTRIPVGKGAEGVASGFGSIWVVAQDDGRLVRIDPDAGKVVASTDIGVGARLVTAGPNAVWVSHFQSGRVLKVDPTSLAVTASESLCAGPQGIVATGDAVWVTCTTGNLLLRLDPSTLSVVSRLSMPTAPDGIVVGPTGSVLVVCQEGPTLVQVDPVDATVRSRQKLGGVAQLYDQANLDVALTPAGAWVSSFTESLVRRVPLG